MNASATIARKGSYLCVPMFCLGVLAAASAVEGSPIVYSRVAVCVLFDCGPGNAIPVGAASDQPNWYIPHEVLTPFVFSVDTVIDEIDYWSQFPFATFTVQKVGNVGSPPCCQNAPPVATLTFAPGGDLHADLFGVDPNCRPPSSCTFYTITMPLATPFIAQAGVPYYLSADADLVVGFRQVGLDAGLSWDVSRCFGSRTPCGVVGAAFILRGTETPEPASLLLVTTGLITIVRLARRRLASTSMAGPRF